MIQPRYMQARTDGQYHRCQSAFITRTGRRMAPGRNGGRQWEGENGGRSCVVLFILHRFIANDGSHANVSGVGSQWIPSAVLSTVLVMREGGA